MDSAKAPSEALLALRRRNKNLIILFLFFFSSLFIITSALFIYVFLFTLPDSTSQTISQEYPNLSLNLSIHTAITHLNNSLDSISLLMHHHSIPDLNNCSSLLRAALTQILYSLEEDLPSDAQKRIATAEGAVRSCVDELENVDASEVKTKVDKAYWAVRNSAGQAAMIGNERNYQRKIELGKMMKEGHLWPLLVGLGELQLIYFGFMYWIFCRPRLPFRK